MRVNLLNGARLQEGFTLLEVLVALMITALVVAAVSPMLVESRSRANAADIRLDAQRFAIARLEELKLTPTAASGRFGGDALGWHWQGVTQLIEAPPRAHVRLRSLKISVWRKSTDGPPLATVETLQIVGPLVE